MCYGSTPQIVSLWTVAQPQSRYSRLDRKGDIMPTWYYRYVSNPPEVKQIVDERKIQSVNPATNYLTWYTPTRYRDVDLAQEELALSYTPTHRLGPIPDMYVVNMDVPLRLTDPAYGFSGGGLEMATLEVIWLCGLWNFNPGTWDL